MSPGPEQTLHKQTLIFDKGKNEEKGKAEALSQSVTALSAEHKQLSDQKQPRKSHEWQVILGNEKASADEKDKLKPSETVKSTKDALAEKGLQVVGIQFTQDHKAQLLVSDRFYDLASEKPGAELSAEQKEARARHRMYVMNEDSSISSVLKVNDKGQWVADAEAEKPVASTTTPKVEAKEVTVGGFKAKAAGQDVIEVDLKNQTLSKNAQGKWYMNKDDASHQIVGEPSVDKDPVNKDKNICSFTTADGHAYAVNADGSYSVTNKDKSVQSFDASAKPTKTEVPVAKSGSVDAHTATITYDAATADSKGNPAKITVKDGNAADQVYTFAGMVKDAKQQDVAKYTTADKKEFLVSTDAKGSLTVTDAVDSTKSTRLSVDGPEAGQQVAQAQPEKKVLPFGSKGAKVEATYVGETLTELDFANKITILQKDGQSYLGKVDDDHKILDAGGPAIDPDKGTAKFKIKDHEYTINEDGSYTVTNKDQSVQTIGGDGLPLKTEIPIAKSGSADAHVATISYGPLDGVSTTRFPTTMTVKDGSAEQVYTFNGLVKDVKQQDVARYTTADKKAFFVSTAANGSVTITDATNDKNTTTYSVGGLETVDDSQS